MKTKFKPGTFVVDDEYHPNIVLKQDKGELHLWDMISQVDHWCSIAYCIAGKTTLEDAIKRIKVFKQEGEKGLLIRCEGWTEKQWEIFAKEWR
jgi:hypothetical protein